MIDKSFEVNLENNSLLGNMGHTPSNALSELNITFKHGKLHDKHNQHDN